MNKWIVTSCVIGGITLAAVAWAEKPEQMDGDRPGPQMMQRPGGGVAGERMAERMAARDGQGQPAREMVLRAVLQNPELAAKVGLSEDKVKAIREAAFAQREQMVKLRSEAELSRMQVEKLSSADKVDKDAVMKAIDAAGQAEVAIKKAEVGFELQVKEMVGPEVIKKIRETMKEHLAERRANAGGEGGEGRGEFRRPNAGGGRPQAPWMQDKMEAPPAPRN